MMNEREEALKDLKEQLDRIKENNRQQIHLITLMADDYSEYAEDVAKLIVNHIKEAPSELKLIGIYVMDSIIKFSGETVEKYRRLFGNEIVKLFVDTFEKAPIAHRQSLFKVRATWQPFFLKSKLFDLDNEVQKIDKSWPIFKQSTTGIPIASPSKSAAVPTASTPATVKPVTAVSQPSVAKPTVPPVKQEKALPVLVKNVPKPQPPTPKKTTTRGPVAATTSTTTVTKTKTVATNNKQSVSDTVVSSSCKTLTKLPKAATSSESSSALTSTNVKSVSPPKTKSAPLDPRIAKKVALETKFESPKKNANAVDPKQVKKELKEIPKQPSKVIKKEPVEVHSQPMDTTPYNGDNKNGKIMRKPPRKHLLDREPRRNRDVPEKKRRIDESHAIQPTAALGSHAFLPPPVSAIPSLPYPMQPPPSISPLGAILPPQIPKTEIEDSWRSSATARLPLQPFNQPPPPIINSGPPPPIINSGPPPMIPSSSMGTSIITNETPRFGATANNRIFVDGRAYEVFYLNNEAVIEQNGLPHRIFFSGPPRDILIDGKPFKLAFDEVRMIHIDDVPHPIKFGAPSRELYVGDHPFRGAFGGPPMVANINGRRHEFRLCGPPPEVRIDQDPCYELSRHMNAVRGPQSVKPKQEEKLGKQDVIALLQKIKQHGILNKPLTISKDDSKTSSFAQKPSPPGPRVDVGTAREISAPPSIKDFVIGSLMVRYSEVVDALHRSRTACPHCGIGFTDTNSEAYQRHIDMHVQELLRTKESGKSRSRAWYMGKENWLEFDELSEVQKQPTTELQKGSTDEGPSQTGDKFASSPSDAIATTSLNKVCSVCHEKFNEYYDNDDEEWRFQECVVKGNVAVHRYCVEQMEDGNDSNGNFGMKQEITQKQTAFPV